MNIIIKEIRVSKELREDIDFWKQEGNVMKNAAAQKLAASMDAELQRMNRLLAVINKEAYGVETL